MENENVIIHLFSTDTALIKHFPLRETMLFQPAYIKSTFMKFYQLKKLIDSAAKRIEFGKSETVDSREPINRLMNRHY